MLGTFGFSWKRYAAIAHIAKIYHGRNRYFGKTALQKQVFFLQVLFGVDLGYDFMLYNYGPYSADLQADLDTAALLDAVRVEYDGGIGGYRIEPSGALARVVEQAGREFSELAPMLESAVSNFIDLRARDLELWATTVFVDREMAGKDTAGHSIVREVRELKPHFTEAEIQEAIRELKAKKFVSAA